MKAHWEQVYSTKATDAVSWYQPHADLSLSLIREAGLAADAAIIDVGGGASTLVDDLLADGHTNLAVLDLSAAALAAAKQRLGERAAAVSWIEADITTATFPEASHALWHDRAVFHFLNAADQRAGYVRSLVRAVKPGGHFIIGTFADDGPEQCSGLPVQRYTAATLHAQFCEHFSLIRSTREAHRTPSGKLQSFVYCWCRKRLA